MNVGECMKHRVFSITASATIAEAAQVFVHHHIGMLPVVDEHNRPIGMLTLRNMLALELPDIMELIRDIDSFHDFGAVETTRPPRELLERAVTTLMRPIVAVTEDCGLLRAYALMNQHDLYDLPVVSANGTLAGIISRADIAAQILSCW